LSWALDGANKGRADADAGLRSVVVQHQTKAAIPAKAFGSSAARLETFRFDGKDEMSVNKMNLRK